MENLILIIFLVLVICIMFLIIMQKQETQLQQNSQSQQLERTNQIEQQYVGGTVLVPYYRWWYNKMFIDYNWWPYYYGPGSSSSTNYSTYKYPKRRHYRHHRHNKHKHSKKHSITIIADKTGKTHVASKHSIIPVTMSGKRESMRLASNKISIRIPNKSAANNKILLLAKSKK